MLRVGMLQELLRSADFAQQEALADALARLGSGVESAVQQLVSEDGVAACLAKAVAHSRSGTLKLRAAQCLVQQMLLGHLRNSDEVYICS